MSHSTNQFTYFNCVMLRQISSNSFIRRSSLAPTEVFGSNLIRRAYIINTSFRGEPNKCVNILFQVLSLATQRLFDEHATRLQVLELHLNLFLFALDFLCNA